MMHLLMNSHFGTARARMLIAIPILAIALAIATATMIALPGGTAFADGGQTTTSENIQTVDNLNPDQADDISTGHCFLAIPCW